MRNSKETRTCISCRKKDNKHNLIRIVNSKVDGIIADVEQNLEGRGAYICKDEQCFNKLKKTKNLSRALRVNIDEEKYNEIRGVVFDR